MHTCCTPPSTSVGEDGPTHQPIEQVMSLRLIPNSTVFRPADALETAAAWKYAIGHKTGPVTLCLSRQNLPVLHEYAEAVHEGALKGGYVLSPAKEMAKAVIIATGSEVKAALDAQKLLAEDGIDVAVVSMPSMEVFEEQSAAYKESVLPKYVPAFAVEAGFLFLEEDVDDEEDFVSVWIGCCSAERMFRACVATLRSSPMSSSFMNPWRDSASLMNLSSAFWYCLRNEDVTVDSCASAKPLMSRSRSRSTRDRMSSFSSAYNAPENRAMAVRSGMNDFRSFMSGLLLNCVLGEIPSWFGGMGRRAEEQDYCSSLPGRARRMTPAS